MLELHFKAALDDDEVPIALYHGFVIRRVWIAIRGRSFLHRKFYARGGMRYEE